MTEKNKPPKGRNVRQSILTQVGRWDTDRKLDFAGDWLAGLSFERLGEKYGIANDPYHVMPAIADFLKLGPRGRVRTKAATSPRRCLRCRDNFESEGIGNRICPRCKNTADWSVGGDYSVSGVARHGG